LLNARKDTGIVSESEEHAEDRFAGSH
jgi:hypothetical protein